MTTLMTNIFMLGHHLKTLTNQMLTVKMTTKCTNDKPVFAIYGRLRIACIHTLFTITLYILVLLVISHILSIKGI